jgi:acyl carrier protein
LPWDPAFEKLVRTYLVELPATQLLAPELSLRASGLNSYSALGLLAEIEDDYDLKFPAELLTFETFDTPANLWAAIQEARALENATANKGR